MNQMAASHLDSHRAEARQHTFLSSAPRAPVMLPFLAAVSGPGGDFLRAGSPTYMDRFYATSLKKMINNESLGFGEKPFVKQTMKSN